MACESVGVVGPEVGGEGGAGLGEQGRSPSPDSPGRAAIGPGSFASVATVSGSPIASPRSAPSPRPALAQDRPRAACRPSRHVLGSRSLKIEPRISLAFSIWASRFSACCRWSLGPRLFSFGRLARRSAPECLGSAPASIKPSVVPMMPPTSARSTSDAAITCGRFRRTNFLSR